ncbi:MAG: hypothetical protein KDC95_01625 [Planctomycetes bacterium]|nr:hypothetical protein [Planctomycetota bacterium]
MRIPLFTLLLTSALTAQTATFTTFGAGCAGSIPGGCPSSNASITQTGNTHNTNIFAHPITPTSTMLLLGFRVFNMSTTNQNETIPTEIYLADSAGAPKNPAIASSTMVVTPNQGWHSTKFLPPIPITANTTFFISHNGGSKVTWSWDASGTNYTHYWHSPTTTTWSGPFLTQKWAFKIDCAGGTSSPQLSATGVPKLGTQYTIDLGNALPNTAAGLIFGVSKSTWGLFQLPLDLTPAGANGCSLNVSFDALTGIGVNAQGVGNVPITVPSSTQLLGVQFHNQYLVIDQQANQLGIAFSNGGTSLIGN